MQKKKIKNREIIAVISAALSSYLSSSEFKIVSVRERRRVLNPWKMCVIRVYRRHIR